MIHERESMMPKIESWSLLLALVLLSGATATLSAQEAEAPEAEAPAEAAEMSQDADAAAAEEAAVEAAHDWLALVDAGEYEESWYESASAFQDAVTPEQWNDALQQARAPLEPLGERTLMSARYTTEIPNAPAGEYVIIQFRTQVTGERTAIETVVPMKSGDDWKVSGYFVQPE